MEQECKVEKFSFTDNDRYFGIIQIRPSNCAAEFNTDNGIEPEKA